MLIGKHFFCVCVCVSWQNQLKLYSEKDTRIYSEKEMGF